MNPDTGEIKDFSLDKIEEAIRNGWVGWSVDELVTIKGCCFRVKEISTENQTITLKAISKNVTKKLTAQSLKKEHGINPEEANMI